MSTAIAIRTVLLMAMAALWETGSSPVTAGEGWGEVRGQIVLKGKIPMLKPLVPSGKASQDPQYCARESSIPNESLIVDRESRGIGNVVVYPVSINFKQIHPNLVRPESDEVNLVTEGCQIRPHIIQVRTGQNLVHRTKDDRPHNVRALPAILPSTGIMTTRDQPVSFPPFAKQFSVPIAMRCAVHPWMEAYVLVLDHPYSAVTGTDGKFQIKNFPAGQHRLRIWHERVRRWRAITVLIGNQVITDIGRVEIDIADVSLSPGELAN